MFTPIKKAIGTLINLIFPQRQKEKMVASLSPEEISELPRSTLQNDHVYSLFSYKDKRVQALIWELKYHRNSKAIETIAQLLSEFLIEELSDRSLFENWKSILLVAVPVSTKRLRERTFCQTDLLCREMKKHLPAEFCYEPNTLKKIKDTEKQSWSKSRQDRLKNLAGAFSADPIIILGKNIILIDDVTTTGATLSECSRTLTGAGAKKIISFTIAH